MRSADARSGKIFRNLLFFSFLLVSLLVALWTHAAEVTLAWDANTEADLAGYRIHYGTASGAYSVRLDVGKVTTFRVTGLAEGETYYFAATAYSATGAESGYSNEVSHTVPAANRAPSTPQPPAGPSEIPVGTQASFSAAAIDPDGDALQFRFDWGNGTVSTWGGPGQSHVFAVAGSFCVRVQAKDAKEALSSWSGCTPLNVLPAPPPLDRDGDGVPDAEDAFPDDPAEWSDADGNGTGDNADARDAALFPPAPVPLYPEEGEEVDTQPELTTAPYRPGADGSPHRRTRWQVFREEDEQIVFDFTSETALTAIRLPKLILEGGTPYCWRAQFVDTGNRASAWSPCTAFSTVASGRDANADGIPDDQEPPASTDLDRNGVPDLQESAIRTVRMEGSSVLIGVSIRDSASAIAIEAIESEDPGREDGYAPDKPRRMPFGLINFRIAVAGPGDAVAVKLHFSAPVPKRGRWYKYNPIDGRWVDFSAYTQFSADRRTMTLGLRDGGVGDADGVANGVIVDPAGIVEVEEEGLSGAAAAGGGGGCFIGEAANPAAKGLQASALTVLSLILAVLAGGSALRRGPLLALCAAAGVQRFLRQRGWAIPRRRTR
ncbi:MAG: choice-of-anchor U domain-containing protein [Desulfobacterales bacterium]